MENFSESPTKRTVHLESIQRDDTETNNVSERWHNRFMIVLGEDHSDLYFCLTTGFQKEQAFTKAYISELALGKLVRAV